MSLDKYDMKMIREEGEDTRQKLDQVIEGIKESNRILTNIYIELIKLNAQEKPWTTIET